MIAPLTPQNIRGKKKWMKKKGSIILPVAFIPYDGWLKIMFDSGGMRQYVQQSISVPVFN
jgi:hypothetical protein